MSELKSLAHPEWPYAGTAHEWRGFVKSERKITPIPPVSDEFKIAWAKNLYDLHADPIYQKQNFGPELP